MEIPFSILAWKIPWTVEPGGLQSTGSQRVRHDWGNLRGKYLLLLYWLCQSLWLCGSQQTGKFFKRWEYQTTWPASWEICIQVRNQQLELDMEQQTGSKSGKEYIKAVYCHPSYLTYMQSTSWEILSSMKHKLESRLLGGNINNLRYADDTTLMAKSEKELKSLLKRVKEESEKLA